MVKLRSVIDASRLQAFVVEGRQWVVGDLVVRQGSVVAAVLSQAAWDQVWMEAEVGWALALVLAISLDQLLTYLEYIFSACCQHPSRARVSGWKGALMGRLRKESLPAHSSGCIVERVLLSCVLCYGCSTACHQVDQEGNQKDDE